jgi:hypothetical protein
MYTLIDIKWPWPLVVHYGLVHTMPCKLPHSRFLLTIKALIELLGFYGYVEAQEFNLTPLKYLTGTPYCDVTNHNKTV